MTRLPPTGPPPQLAELGYDNGTWDRPWNLARGHLTTLERMPSVELQPGGAAVPLPPGPALDVEALTFRDPLTGRDLPGGQFLDRRVFTDALCVLHRGRLVFETYRGGMREDDRHLCHSCTKTMTTMAVGIAVQDGALDVDRPVREYVTELAALPAWDAVTVQHVLDMAAGLDTEEHYEDPASMYWRYADAVGYYGATNPDAAGVLGFALRELDRRAEPAGHRFNYASYLTNLLPVVLERVSGVPAVEWYESRLYGRLGAERPALLNVDRLGAPIVEGQLNLTLRDFARWGGLLLTGGRALDGGQVVPEAWVQEWFRPSPLRGQAFSRSDYAELLPGAQYHNQAWLLDPGRTVAMLGIHGQFCYADRDADLLVVGFSSFPDQANALLINTLRELWATIGSALAS